MVHVFYVVQVVQRNHGKPHSWHRAWALEGAPRVSVGSRMLSAEAGVSGQKRLSLMGGLRLEAFVRQARCAISMHLSRRLGLVEVTFPPDCLAVV